MKTIRAIGTRTLNPKTFPKITSADLHSFITRFGHTFSSSRLDACQGFPSFLNVAGINTSPRTNVATKNPVSD
jgi:hypothetical protein